MRQKRIGIERRSFLKLGSLAAVSIAVASRADNIFAQAAPPRVDEGETKAQGLGYRHDATGVDRRGFSKYQPGQMCSNCQFFKGASGNAWGPCQIFKGREVSAKGWCVSYWKKT